MKDANESTPWGIEPNVEPHYFLSAQSDNGQARFMEEFSQEVVFGAIKKNEVLFEIYSRALPGNKRNTVSVPTELPICVKAGFQHPGFKHKGFSLRHIIGRGHLTETNIDKAFNKSNQTLALMALVKELLLGIDTVLHDENNALLWMPEKKCFIFAAKSNTLSACRREYPDQYPDEHIFCTLCFDGNYRLAIGTLYSISESVFKSIKIGEYSESLMVKPELNDSSVKEKENNNNQLEKANSYVAIEKNLLPEESTILVKAVMDGVIEPSFQMEERDFSKCFDKKINDFFDKQERSLVSQNRIFFEMLHSIKENIKKILDRKKALETLKDGNFKFPLNEYYSKTYKLIEKTLDIIDSRLGHSVKNVNKKIDRDIKRHEKIKEIIQFYANIQDDKINKKTVTVNKLVTIRDKLFSSALEQMNVLVNNADDIFVIFLRKICDFLSYAIENEISEENEQYTQFFEEIYKIKDTRLKMVCNDQETMGLREEFIRLSKLFLDKCGIREKFEEAIKNEI